ncbi:beta-glucosidase family protein, partial [Frankia nepalensis]|nr:glycoside hydrolase family 3 C-terminal domain-containing protein [Frankia nepalensis]
MRNADAREPADLAGVTADEIERRVAEALAGLDLADRIRLLTGASFWRTRPAPGIGLRSVVLSDGPAGVRGERADEREPSACLPCPSALAATWDEALLRRVGGLLAAQARAKGVDVVLGPTVNLHRSPLGGRHFECLSEDPLLTARMAGALVAGLQAGGVAATVKHYVANESETDRFTVDARVDERALREVYLAPFEALVTEHRAWAVMAAYNSVGGVTMTENPLLRDPLQDEWGFDGLVVSDWIATRSTVPSALAGLDLVMPGPLGPWGPALVAAVRAGQVPAEVVEDKARRLLRLAARVGALKGPSASAPPAGAVPAARAGDAPVPAGPAGGADAGSDPAGPYARRLLRAAAAAGMVLLRNEDGLLPLAGLDASRADATDNNDATDNIGATDAAGATGRPRRIAVIGPNATLPRAQGGGSATVCPPHLVGPADGLRAALGGDVEVVTATGVRGQPWPAPLSMADARDPRTGEPGLRVSYLDEQGRQLRAEHRLSASLLYFGDPALAGAARIEVSALLTARVTGHHPVGFAGTGGFALSARVGGAGEAQTALFDGVLTPADGDVVAGFLRPPVWTGGLDLTAGQEVLLTLRHDLPAGMPFAAFALLGEDPWLTADEELAAAVELAGSADVAVVVVGTSERAESEGVDRAGLALPEGQDDLVRRVAAANPRTVVVVNAGAPVLLPWREEVPAVLLSWFPGQEFGAALADVLLGGAEPGGRLPTTWPAREEDCPVWSVTPVDGGLDYAEGIHVGYRGWAGRARGAEGSAASRAAAAGPVAVPAYPFGHGLGYTTWSYLALDVPETVVAGEPALIRVTVRNTGGRPGRAVVQAYLSRSRSAVDRPALWLAGFGAADAAPGEVVTVTVRLAPRAFGHWRPAAGGRRGGWETEPGAFELRVGPSSAT